MKNCHEKGFRLKVFFFLKDSPENILTHFGTVSQTEHFFNIICSTILHNVCCEWQMCSKVEKCSQCSDKEGRLLENVCKQWIVFKALTRALFFRNELNDFVAWCSQWHLVSYQWRETPFSNRQKVILYIISRLILPIVRILTLKKIQFGFLITVFCDSFDTKVSNLTLCLKNVRSIN